MSSSSLRVPRCHLLQGPGQPPRGLPGITAAQGPSTWAQTEGNPSLGNLTLARGTNIAGRNTLVNADGGFLNNAFTVLGSGNTVTAGPGPLAVAGSLLQTNATVTKQQFGFNINGVRLPNTAAAESNAKSVPGVAASSATGTGKRAAPQPTPTPASAPTTGTGVIPSPTAPT